MSAILGIMVNKSTTLIIQSNENLRVLTKIPTVLHKVHIHHHVLKALSHNLQTCRLYNHRILSESLKHRNNSHKQEVRTLAPWKKCPQYKEESVHKRLLRGQNGQSDQTRD